MVNADKVKAATGGKPMSIGEKRQLISNAKYKQYQHDKKVSGTQAQLRQHEDSGRLNEHDEALQEEKRKREAKARKAAEFRARVEEMEYSASQNGGSPRDTSAPSTSRGPRSARNIVQMPLGRASVDEKQVKARVAAMIEGRTQAFERGHNAPRNMHQAKHPRAAAAAGEDFEAVVSYAGQGDVFIIAGKDTYVPVELYASWRPVHEGDRLRGARVANRGGSSKWRAVSVAAVLRDEGPAPSPMDAWFESSQALLDRVSTVGASVHAEDANGASAAATGLAAEGGATGDGAASVPLGGPASAIPELAKRVDELLDLALTELGQGRGDGQPAQQVAPGPVQPHVEYYVDAPPTPRGDAVHGRHTPANDAPRGRRDADTLDAMYAY